MNNCMLPDPIGYPFRFIDLPRQEYEVLSEARRIARTSPEEAHDYITDNWPPKSQFPLPSFVEGA